jgi:flagellar biosynthesis/type III secretory pathway chaperone
MNTQFRIPDPETRAKSIAKLREACRQLDLANLMLDEAIALADADLLKQRKARLLYNSNYLPTEQLES